MNEKVTFEAYLLKSLRCKVVTLMSALVLWVRASNAKIEQVVS